MPMNTWNNPRKWLYGLTADEMAAEGDQVTSQRDWVLADRVTVARTDLEYLLAHYWDEIHGDPDRSHWRQPLLREAVTRLAGSLGDPS